MGVSKDEIRDWLRGAKKAGATHMLVMCDTFDYECYPVYVLPGEDPRERALKPGEMQRVEECYSLALDIERQLAEGRAHHYEIDPIAVAVKAELDKER